MFRRRKKNPEFRQPAELAPFPGVALRVLQLASEEDASPAELVAVARMDAAISARILRLANSSLYGFRTEIDTLTAAGVALGSQKLVEVVLASAVSLYHAPRGHLTEAASRQLWRRSLATALCAQDSALEQGIDPARAFFAGLFVPIGLLRFHQVYPPRTVERVRTQYFDGLGWREAQRRVFGVDHLQEGARLVRDWGLPAWIASSMIEARAPQPIDFVGRCLREADVVACTLLLEEGELGEDDYWTMDVRSVEACALDERTEAMRELLRERTRGFDEAA